MPTTSLLPQHPRDGFVTWPLHFYHAPKTMVSSLKRSIIPFSFKVTLDSYPDSDLYGVGIPKVIDMNTGHGNSIKSTRTAHVRNSAHRGLLAEVSLLFAALCLSFSCP